MSFLYPLLLAGIAAIGLPILLHMIRRHTRQRVAFSSLMFLRPTMPRFRSRSRLEHVLLLLVRCSILCLLALAFARPFLRQRHVNAEQGVEMVGGPEKDRRCQPQRISAHADIVGIGPGVQLQSDNDFPVDRTLYAGP